MANDFASILDAVSAGKCVVESVASSKAVAEIKPDQVQLSLQAQKVMGPRAGKKPVQPRKPDARADIQGNKTRFSALANELGAREIDRVVWETRTKIRTDLPAIKIDQQKIKPLLEAGILKTDS